MIRFHCDWQTKKFSKTGFTSLLSTWSTFGAHRVKDPGFCHSVMPQAHFFSNLHFRIRSGCYTSLHHTHIQSSKRQERGEKGHIPSVPNTSQKPYVLFPCPGQKWVNWQHLAIGEVGKCSVFILSFTLQTKARTHETGSLQLWWAFELVLKAD